jgi:hypothetical protein
MAVVTEGEVKLDPGADSRWHMKIERTQRMPNTRAGHWLYLACGHRSMAFGNLEYAGGVVLCTQCRDRDEGADARIREAETGEKPPPVDFDKGRKGE